MSCTHSAHPLWWWDRTWNTFGGCQYHSPGCLLCYAAVDAGTVQQEAGADRLVVPLYDGVVDRVKGGGFVFNGNQTVLPPGHAEWTMPLTWPGAEVPLLGPGKPSLIFVASMSEPFLAGRAQAILDRTFGTVALSKHIGQVLTKNPRRMAEYFTALDSRTVCRWQQKFWLGFSAERQQEFDARWPYMRGLAERGWVIFVSIAPMIGPVTLPTDFLAYGARVWVICSGEQGRPHERCRDMDPAWVRAVRDQCAGRVPLFVKQMARLAPIPPDLYVRQFHRPCGISPQINTGVVDGDFLAS